MTNQNRILSIDIMRGLTLLLMLFVNDLNMKVAPHWLGHMEANFDGMGLADWVFPGFLFIVGMAIPFAFSKRFSRGEKIEDLSRHILTRSVSLIIIGVLMLNTGRVNPELTGFSKDLWALLMYIAVFLFWNDYRDSKERIYTVAGYKLVSLAIFIFLVFRFRSGEPENSGSLITGWWGILGLIGWGYLVAAFHLCSLPRFDMENSHSCRSVFYSEYPFRTEIAEFPESCTTFYRRFNRRKCSVYCTDRINCRTDLKKVSSFGTQKSNSHFRSIGDNLNHFRFYTPSLVHHFKNKSYSQLGNDL